MHRFIIFFFAVVTLLCGAAVRAKAEPIIAINNANVLIRFDSASPGLVSTSNVTGLMAGDSIVGIDFRPANGLLYAVTSTVPPVPGSSINRIYTLNPLTGAATFVSSLTTVFLRSVAGVDFNPVADRLRVVTADEENLRVNVDTGETIVDTPLNGVPSTASVTGAAYTNNFAGATSTTLYVIDAESDSLFIQNPPNAGTLNLVGPLGVDTNNAIGFDISGVTGIAYASLNQGSASSLYTINLTTGAPTLVGQIGTGSGFFIRGITAAPAAPVPEPATMLLLGTGLAGVGAVVRKRRKAKGNEEA